MNSSPERRCCPSWARAANENARVEQIPIEIGLVGLDRLQQLVDELLMTLRYLDDSHITVYFGASSGGSSARVSAVAKEERGDSRTWMPLRRRIDRRRAELLARLLRAPRSP